MFFDEEPLMECPSCKGLGEFTIGDCEDGVYDICPDCEGTGIVENEDDAKGTKYGEDRN
jgi:DnaJ-class molecular chaperone